MQQAGDWVQSRSRPNRRGKGRRAGPRKRSSGAFLAPNARERFRGQRVDAADSICSRHMIGCKSGRARPVGAVRARSDLLMANLTGYRPSQTNHKVIARFSVTRYSYAELL